MHVVASSAVPIVRSCSSFEGWFAGKQGTVVQVVDACAFVVEAVVVHTVEQLE